MTEQRGRPVLVHVLDPYIPGKEASPPFLTKAWRSHVTRKVISPVRFWFAKRKVKRLITGWTPAAFAEEAQTLYADMNVAFAKGDKETLSDVVTDSLLAKLMTEMKQTQKLGRVQWKSHGVASPTKMVHMVVGKAQLERNGTEFSVAQATVRINMKQSVAIFDQRGRIVGGDPNVVKDIVEHVVLERWLDRPDVPHVWKIAARLGVAPTPSPPSTS
ncbi:hypothetical protein DFS34DRAFT_592101 [Phlyctochytrium arcticum]|nr:hypothetical protein DFS34DRAFT_592101 [Phlyctochytrium arcticum]